jgi:hypothetical protein
VVGDVRFAGERDRDDLLGLVVVERAENEAMELFDVDWSTAGFGGGLSGTYGLGVSWRIMASR